MNSTGILPQAIQLRGVRGKPKVLVIAGPTASGKTRLSIELGELLGGEVLSADSMQVYQGLDIGTAKATAEDRSLIAHHLLDLVTLDEPFNVAEYYKEAILALQQVIGRGNLPMLVGGSGFYVHSLIYGPPEGPPSVFHVREQLERQMDDLGADALYERVQLLDPVYAATISEKDRHKIIRALEIMILSDRRVSDFAKEVEVPDDRYDFRCFFIHYPRQELYTRIEERCDQMIHQGLMDEVKKWLEPLRSNVSASQAIGYRQAIEYLDSAKTPDDWATFLQSFKRASRAYAKRQFTWFKKEPLFTWLNVGELGLEGVKEKILQDLLGTNPS